MSIIKNSEASNRAALLIQYDGACFNGWQVQNTGRTVQGEIENALEILLKEKVRIYSAGRTDTGVHALGQVAHFNLSPGISLQKLCVSLNGILKKDVAVKNAYFVPPCFHARFDAIQREYIYVIYNHPLMSPFIVNRAMWVNYNLDIDFLKNASRYFIGEKDFASFCKKQSAEENTVRRIDEFEITKQEDYILFRIAGTAFLHNMIRIIAGTLLEIYRNRKDPGEIQSILDQKDRDASGKTAPACGLYLNKIKYTPPLSEMESAFKIPEYDSVSPVSFLQHC
jgi:tRNA pseudouridine38-40 synthase